MARNALVGYGTEQERTGEMILTNLMNDMLQAIEQGDLQAIEPLLDTFLTNEEPAAQYEVAETFMQYGYMQEADRVFEHLQFLFPEEAQIAIDRATVLIELGQEDDALELLMGVSEDAAEYPQALLVLADYYQMQGLHEVAEQRINDALEILPNEPLIQFAKAELLFEIGRFTEAVRLYEELYEVSKVFAGVSLAQRLAEVYRAGAAYEQALEFYMEALEDEVSPDMLFGSAYAAFQIEKYETAIMQLEDLKELDPDYFSAYLLLAESYAMTENNAKALKAIEEGLKRDEYDKSLYLFAGKIALKNSDNEKAEQYLQQAIALDPEYMEALLVLTSIYSKQERYAEVIDLYENLQRDNFDWSALSPFVAEAYNQEEQYDKAYEIYRNAYNDFKEDIQFLESYAYFLLEEGKQAEAKEIAEQLVALQPTEQQWHDLLERFE